MNKLHIIGAYIVADGEVIKAIHDDKSVSIGDIAEFFVGNKLTIGKVVRMYKYDGSSDNFTGASVVISYKGVEYIRRWHVEDVSYYNLSCTTTVWIKRKNSYKVELV